MPAAKKAIISGKRAWVGGSQDQVLGIGNRLGLLLGIITPKEKHNWGIFLIQELDDPIGKLFPTLIAVGLGLVCSDSEHGIQE